MENLAPWFNADTMRLALRKHVMRADLRIYAGEESEFASPNDMQGAIKSMLTAAIMKGLDVIGIVSLSGPQVGWQARQLAQRQHIDLWVIPGQEYVTADRFHLLVYNLKAPLSENLPVDGAISEAHKQGGFVMAAQLSKRQAQHIGGMGKNGPDAIEIYCAALGGFQDTEVNLKRFVNSGAKNASEMEDLNAFTLIPRHDIEAMRLLPPDEGADYEPAYLTRGDDDGLSGAREQTAPPAPTPAPPAV